MEKTPALHFYCCFYRHQSSGMDRNVVVFLHSWFHYTFFLSPGAYSKVDNWRQYHVGDILYYEVLSVPLINQPHDDFYFFRQASLNDAAEKYYKQAASLRPDVSSKPWHFTVSYSTLIRQSHICGCLESDFVWLDICKISAAVTREQFHILNT